MWHDTFITLHAGSGVVAFGAGCAALRRRQWLVAYVVALVGLVLFLSVVVAIDWWGLNTTARALYCALLALGVYMLGRAVRARRLASDRGARASVRYLDHIGFTLVALFDGFAIVAAVDLGAPGWLVAVIGAAGAGVGHLTIQRHKRTLDGAPPTD